MSHTNFMRFKLTNLLLVFLLVFSSFCPVMAADCQTKTESPDHRDFETGRLVPQHRENLVYRFSNDNSLEGEMPLAVLTDPTTTDIRVIVQDDNGYLYVLSTSKTNPASWFNDVKPYDTVKVIRDLGDNTALVQIGSNTPVPSGSGYSYAMQTVPAALLLGLYLVPGVGEVTLIATGVVIIAGATNYLATSDNPTAVTIREEFGKHTPTFLRALTPEQEYNDAKRKGIPVGSNKNKDKVTHGKRLPEEGKPFSSTNKFFNDKGKADGCPNQIRYYGKDGKPEMDIDFYGPEHETFPHKHYWRNGVRSPEQRYDGIEDVIKNWKCKNYDFKNNRFQGSAL